MPRCLAKSVPHKPATLQLTALSLYPSQNKSPPNSMEQQERGMCTCMQAEQVEAWPKLPSSVKLEVGSPYAYLCEDAKIMTAPIGLRGWPGLWPLPATIVRKAELFLVSPPQVISVLIFLLQQARAVHILTTILISAVLIWALFFLLQTCEVLFAGISSWQD